MLVLKTCNSMNFGGGCKSTKTHDNRFYQGYHDSQHRPWNRLKTGAQDASLRKCSVTEQVIIYPWGPSVCSLSLYEALGD